MSAFPFAKWKGALICDLRAPPLVYQPTLTFNDLYAGIELNAKLI